MASSGEKFFTWSLAGITVFSLSAYATEGEKWHLTHNDQGTIDGAEWGPETTAPDTLPSEFAGAEVESLEASAPETTSSYPSETIPPTQTETLFTAIREAGMASPWCSSLYLEFVSYDPAVPGLYIPEPASGSEVQRAQVCLDPESVQIRDMHVEIAMGTERPDIPQTEGNPSLFLTYQEPVNVPKCLDAKEEMRESFHDSLAQIVGPAVSQLSVEIHVDMRNLDHPCDDSFTG